MIFDTTLYHSSLPPLQWASEELVSVPISAIKALPALRKTSVFQRGPCNRHQLLESVVCHCTGKAEADFSEGQTQGLRSVLRVLHHSDFALGELQIGNLDVGTPAPCRRIWPAQSERAKLCLSKVEKLSVQVEHYDDSEISKMLATGTGLRSLHIQRAKRRRQSMAWFPDARVFLQSFRVSHRQPSLQVLSIRNFCVSARYIARFLLLHAVTLVAVELYRVDINLGSWAGTLEILKGARNLKKLSLGKLTDHENPMWGKSFQMKLLSAVRSVGITCRVQFK